MSLKKISFECFKGLKDFNSGGGQGRIYVTPTGKLLKVYQPESPQEAAMLNARLEKLGRDENLFEGMKYFCAIPEVIVQDKDNNLVGFQMSNFQNFLPINALLSKPFCVNERITIRQVITIFLTMHDLLSKIHSKGFIVGDFNDDNILFELVNKSVHLAFVDVDSWAVCKSHLQLSAPTNNQTFCHPAIENDMSKLQPHHDWYSYALMLSRSLIKGDPFNTGLLDDSTNNAIQGNRRKNGITCWDKRVTLDDERSQYIKRFGKELTSTLEKWLRGDIQGVFPKEVLERFLDGLAMCKGAVKGKQCALEVHIDHVNCTKCGIKLTKPVPRAKSVTKNSKSAEPLNGLLKILLEKGG